MKVKTSAAGKIYEENASGPPPELLAESLDIA